MPARKPVTLQEGTRVLFCNGLRLGTVERWNGRHGGYMVRFDEKGDPLENELCRVHGRDLTPTDPKLHEIWEALWPAFIDRSWAVGAPERDRA